MLSELAQLAPHDWHKRPIEDVCLRVTSGGTPSRSNKEFYKNGKWPWVKTQELLDCWLEDTEEHITDDAIEKSSAKILPEKTVLLALYGATVGQLGILRRSMTCNQACCAMIVNEDKADFRYLYNALLSSRTQLKGLASGAAQQNLSGKLIREFVLPFPDLSIQRRIAHILGTLDDKIELNRRMNRTLEKMAAAIFKSWFIDFDPVRRNAARAHNQPSPKPSPNGRGSGNYRGGYDFAGLVETARAMRKNPTDAETLFWELVRDRRFLGLKFRRQHQLGDYVADFYCHEYRLVVELDGGVHRTKQKKDLKRDAWMVSQGFKVLRIRNEQLLDDPAFVLEQIAEIISSPSPSGRRAGDEGCVETFDALFPDSFKDSDLGPIPKGWTVAPMKDLADVNVRSIKKDYLHARIRYVDISSVTQGSLNQTTTYDLADAPSRAKRLVQTGDTIWSCVRPNRKAYLYIDRPADNLVVSTGFAVLSPREVPASYLHQWVTTQAFVDYLTAYATGAAYPAVKADIFETATMILPAKDILKAFHDLVGPLRARIAHNQRQNRRLAGLRDTLLPKLLSGEIELPAAEVRLTRKD